MNAIRFVILFVARSVIHACDICTLTSASRTFFDHDCYFILMLSLLKANVGCSDGCRCEACENVYGQKGGMVFLICIMTIKFV